MHAIVHMFETIGGEGHDFSMLDSGEALCGRQGSYPERKFVLHRAKSGGFCGFQQTCFNSLKSVRPNMESFIETSFTKTGRSLTPTEVQAGRSAKARPVDSASHIGLVCPAFSDFVATQINVTTCSESGEYARSYPRPQSLPC
jgi:hypothetical protein